MAASLQSGAGPAWPGPSLPHTPPPRLLLFLAPDSPHLSLQRHPNGSRFLTWSRAGPPAPGRPPFHRTRPPPCSPSVVRLHPAMEDLGEWGWVPLSPALHHPLDLLPHTGAPLHSPPASPHPCLLTSGFCLCRSLLSNSTSPFLPLPSCLSQAGRSLPSRLAPLFLHRLRTDGQGGAVAPAGLLGSGTGGVKGILGLGTGKGGRKGGRDTQFWRRKSACPGVSGRKALRGP